MCAILLRGGGAHMNTRKYNTDPALLLEQGKAIMSSSDESRFLFRVFARSSQNLCKPPMWCSYSTPHRRFTQILG